MSFSGIVFFATPGRPTSVKYRDLVSLPAGHIKKKRICGTKFQPIYGNTGQFKERYHYGLRLLYLGAAAYYFKMLDTASYTMSDMVYPYTPSKPSRSALSEKRHKDELEKINGRSCCNASEQCSYLTTMVKSVPSSLVRTAFRAVQG